MVLQEIFELVIGLYLIYNLSGKKDHKKAECSMTTSLETPRRSSIRFDILLKIVNARAAGLQPAWEEPILGYNPHILATSNR